ncbi:MAG TPA: WbuC family cupin fold metalloprotein [Sandaracinaceae bacterium LLY-WYZ-13_1]|nr:WbuC family cupin fold metalloprotein [Sandaracinaceae bacterium LLY-WYZ-13_1]
MSDLELIDDALLDRVRRAAEQSPRRRTNHDFHAGPQDNPHRFLNVMLRGTYVTPHRHRDPPKSESFLVLRGEVAVFLFDDDGRVTARHDLGGAGRPFGLDLAPGVWHSLAVLGDHAVIYEVKPGPWDPATDKEFAPWAPREHDEARHAYLDRLLALHPPTPVV